jgi:hypothetical protein
MRIKDLRTRWQLRLKSESKSSEFDRKAFGLEFVKRANGMSNGFRKIRKWTLWRVDPLQNGKRSCRYGVRAEQMWGHRPVQELQPTLLCVRKKKSVYDWNSLN